MASVAIRDVYPGSRFFSVPDPESKGNKKEEGGTITINFTKFKKPSLNSYRKKFEPVDKE
jgi:hypothetical protein